MLQALVQEILQPCYSKSGFFFIYILFKLWLTKNERNTLKFTTKKNQLNHNT